MSRLDSQASHATRPTGHKIHTLKRNTAKCWNVPYFSSDTEPWRRRWQTQPTLRLTVPAVKNQTAKRRSKTDTNSSTLRTTRTNYRPSRQTPRRRSLDTWSLPTISLFPISLSLSFFLWNSPLCRPAKYTKTWPAWPVSHSTGHQNSHVSADRTPTMPINQSLEMLKIGPIDVTGLAALHRCMADLLLTSGDLR